MRIRSIDTLARSCDHGLINYRNVPVGHAANQHVLDPGDVLTWSQIHPCSAGHKLLYRFHDATSELLYVGVTWNPKERWKCHRKTKDWWFDVVRADVECHPSEELAHAAEYVAITTESPRYNRHGIRRTRSVEVSA